MSKKMEDREEISAKWTGIKSKFPTLSKGLFNPDLSPVIKSYDQALQAWDKMDDLAEKLGDVLSEMNKNLEKASSSMDSLRDERDKIDKKDMDLIKNNVEKINAYVGKKDLNMVDGQVLSLLNGYALALDDAYTMHKSLSDQLGKHGAAMVAAAKKARDDYKSKSDVITAGYKKAEADALKLEAQIRQIDANYQKVAVQMENTDLVEALRSLLDNF